MNRPRRALLEEPEDAEPQLAKRASSTTGDDAPRRARRAGPSRAAMGSDQPSDDLARTPEAGGPDAEVPARPRRALTVPPLTVPPLTVPPLPASPPLRLTRDLPPAISPAERALHWRIGHEVEPIIVRRLVKSYNGVLAVCNLSFVIEPGRVTGFLGPNGAGKTTTLRILVGLVAATTGTATFGGTAYADLPRPQQTVGCVLDANVHPGRTGRNHLRVLAPTAGASDRRVDAVLEQVGLAGEARRPAGHYSLGMRQRLALAAALLGNPDYLILDEPANGLDPEGIRWLRSLLREFAGTGRAVLISSHLLNEVEATADDIVVIDKGRLVAQLPISELNIGARTICARVSDISAAIRALRPLAADVEAASDERGPFLRTQGADVGAIGAALFGAGVVVYELVTERRDLEAEFFAMLGGTT